MVIINLQDVLSMLPNSIDEHQRVIDSSYEMIVKKFNQSKFFIVEHLFSQHIAIEDFTKSINEMISFYEQSSIEDYSKCNKLLEIKSYLINTYEELMNEINVVNY